jgi:hypothetical protein
MILIHHRLHRLRLFAATVLIAAFVGACCCCKDKHAAPTHYARAGGPKHIGRIEVPADAVANTTYEPKGDSSPPKVYGRARFNGTVVAYDLLFMESTPAQIEDVYLNYTSHQEGVTPIFWPYPAPDPTPYTQDPPKTRWYIYDLPATWSSTAPNDCFHVRVDAFDHYGQLVYSVSQKFSPPVTTTTWSEWVPGG